MCHILFFNAICIGSPGSNAKKEQIYLGFQNGLMISTCERFRFIQCHKAYYMNGNL